jgi:hypothetical protein
MNRFMYQVQKIQHQQNAHHKKSNWYTVSLADHISAVQ